jgi:hypothetical protein
MRKNHFNKSVMLLFQNGFGYFLYVVHPSGTIYLHVLQYVPCVNKTDAHYSHFTLFKRKIFPTLKQIFCTAKILRSFLQVT